jgi:hypothetical protein
MSIFKSQFSRALNVIPSDNVNIPYPNLIKEGFNSAVSTNQLVDETVNFNELNVKTGDIVYTYSNFTAATVVEVINDNTLLLNGNIFTASPQSYSLFAASSQNTIGNSGCNLYIGGAGNVRVTTIGGDILTFTAVPLGTVLPVQVIKLHSEGSGTTATLINALW